MAEQINIDGKWLLTRSMSAGKEGASPDGTFLLIKGTIFERHTPGYIFERQLVFNNAVLPYQIDLHITNDPDKGKTFLGIYKVEGNVLTIAHALPGRPRPTSFESTEENEQILSISTKQA